MIITANRFFNTSWQAYKIAAITLGLAKHGLKDFGVDKSEPVMAFVNKGKWLIKCECGGAEKAWEEGLFMCQSCWNAGHKHKCRRSIFPEQREEIERLLDKRPLENRNWFPGETVDDLLRENKEHEAELLEA